MGTGTLAINNTGHNEIVTNPSLGSGRVVNQTNTYIGVNSSTRTDIQAAIAANNDTLVQLIGAR